MSAPTYFQAELHIQGMTCASCEMLLERRLKAVPGVHAADVSSKTGIARITAEAGKLPDERRIAAAVEKAGYALAGDAMSASGPADPPERKWMEIGGSLVIILALYKLLQTFDLVSLAPSASGALSLGGVFVIGLVAGTSSCLAVAGGLLLAMAAKYNQAHQSQTGWEKFRPLLRFNAGRLASYLVLGGAVGWLGRSITLSTAMNGYMSIGIALVMLYLGLTILDVIPKNFPVRPPKRLARRIAALSESSHPLAPFALGALTFFLPCGFTQSLQLAALASGSPLAGASIMFVFALGTLPSLLGISAVSSTAKGGASRLFLRFSGTLVVLLALLNFGSGFALTGLDIGSAFASGSRPVPGIAAAPQDGIQEVAMKVTRSGYEPSSLTIKAGLPVRWLVDGEGAVGCTSQLVVPALGITKPLSRGMNEIDFTAPSQPGRLAFSCSMGMVRGSFTVL